MRMARSMLRLAGRLGGLVGLLTLLAGVTAGLWHFVGWPLPRRVPTDCAGWERIMTSSFPDPARTVADLADPHGRWRVAPAADRPTVVTPATPATVRAGDLAARHLDTGRLPRFAAAGFDGPLRVQVGAHHYTYPVRNHDTLWDVAGAWLGDHRRWPEIYHLNADRYDQHGRMRHGDHIEPGWVLVLPD